MPTEETESVAEPPSEAGELAERYGISLFVARQIIDECGSDLALREERARQASKDVAKQ
jgi:hypothetical protein